MTESCGICRYFRPPSKGEAVGLCRRYPKPLRKSAGEWCGEWLSVDMTATDILERRAEPPPWFTPEWQEWFMKITKLPDEMRVSPLAGTGDTRGIPRIEGEDVSNKEATAALARIRSVRDTLT